MVELAVEMMPVRRQWKPPRVFIIGRRGGERWALTLPCPFDGTRRLHRLLPQGQKRKPRFRRRKTSPAKPLKLRFRAPARKDRLNRSRRKFD